jgi:hypothetical protein
MTLRSRCEFTGTYFERVAPTARRQRPESVRSLVAGWMQQICNTQRAASEKAVWLQAVKFLLQLPSKQ